jgi:hypothetical protein
MLRKVSIIAALSALLAGPGLAQTPVSQLATPPSDAKVWTISNNDGAQKHGTISLWTDQSGAHWSRFSMNLRGFKTEIDQQMHFAPDGELQSLVVRGFTPSGDAGETYQVENGAYDWKSQVDYGTGKTRPDLAYVSFSGTPDSFLFIVDALLKSPTHSIDLLPSGKGGIEPLTTLDIDNNGVKKHLTCYALTASDCRRSPSGWKAISFSRSRPDCSRPAGKNSTAS